MRRLDLYPLDFDLVHVEHAQHDDAPHEHLDLNEHTAKHDDHRDRLLNERLDIDRSGTFYLRPGDVLARDGHGGLWGVLYGHAAAGGGPGTPSGSEAVRSAYRASYGHARRAAPVHRARAALDGAPRSRALRRRRSPTSEREDDLNTSRRGDSDGW